MEQLKDPPPFMKSVNELGGLAVAINAFQSRLQDLLNHVDFIQNTIETKENSLQRDENKKSLEQQPPEIVSETTQHQSRAVDTDTEKEDTRDEIVTETKTKTEVKNGRSGRSELQYLAKMMCIRGLRKYVVSHLSEIENLRGEAVLALKSAPNPGKLVLDCVGRFFLQGSKAYTKDSPMISSRQASVLMLELFLRVIGESEEEIEIESLVKQEAEENAIAWRKRLISEGGVRRACEIDARGLLLFIACFGIPKAFKDEDVRDLIRCSNLKEIGHLLKGSRVLVAKIPGIIENMKKNGMHVEAVDVVYTFGIEDKFSPQTILISFLRESKDAWKKTKRDAPIPLKEANEKHLAALTSVIKCMEDRKLDPAKLLPGWQIKDKIVKLEKDIADLNKQIMEHKITPKRKAGESESSNKLNSQEIKRSRFTANGSSMMANGSSLMSSPGVLRLHDPQTANCAEGKSSYDQLTPNLLDGGFSGFISSQPAVPAPSRVYNTGTSADLGTVVGGGSNVHAVGTEVGISPGIYTLPTGSFAGGEMSALKVGQTMYANGYSYGWQTERDVPYNQRLIGQSLTGQPAATGVDGFYRPSPSIERFAGLLNAPSIGVGNQNPSSDLYSFADSVI